MGDDQLRVLLVAALPHERRFAYVREDLMNLETALNNISGLDVLKRIESWDENLVGAYMTDRAKPVHVVHVLGICRGEPGDPKLFTGAADAPFGNPRPLVDALTGPGTVLPRLAACCSCTRTRRATPRRTSSVSLRRSSSALCLPSWHCSMPKLPREEEWARSSTEALLSGTRVGTAVQETRQRFSAKGPTRRLGTPALYLGEDGYLKRQRRQKEPSGAVLTRGAEAMPVDERQVRELLVKVVKGAALDEKRERDWLTWVKKGST